MASCKGKIVEAESARLKKAFGKAVSSRRLAHKFEQREFSRVVGISNSHLRKIESGETSPTLTTIDKIARALDTDAADLVCESCRLVRKETSEIAQSRS
ncbi:helix-turn-helix transcriptional regulator [Adlercreutzia sp. ZJ242]|uniref:helix-turn-helix domain-containing protein n=1 Tax=Adlercreutzia sp. ZJ242 TaxID=2709409 RepID=UPI0013EADB60